LATPSTTQDSTLLAALRLLQLGDSALAIGSLAHSFGLETMVEERQLSVGGLFAYLREWLSEGLLLDAVYCRAAHSRALCGSGVQDLNERLSAIRLARESRQASLALGRRFIKLVAALEASLGIEETHFVVAFGYAGGILSFDVDHTVMTFLHQSVLNAISAAQRLMRLGQMEANRIAWALKPVILDTVSKSRSLGVEDVYCFAHLPELAAMRHPTLGTRLFMS
jgi:urease accessory protein